MGTAAAEVAGALKPAVRTRYKTSPWDLVGQCSASRWPMYPSSNNVQIPMKIWFSIDSSKNPPRGTRRKEGAGRGWFSSLGMHFH